MFASCHEDFVRVLISLLVVNTFFSGDMICQHGDINNCMYFIHKGKVDVLSVEKNFEVLVDLLYERDCFGVVIKNESKQASNCCKKRILRFKVCFLKHLTRIALEQPQDVLS